MISLPSAVRIFLCTRDVDLRKSFDGLSGLVHDCFGQDPLSSSFAHSGGALRSAEPAFSWHSVARDGAGAA